MQDFSVSQSLEKVVGRFRVQMWISAVYPYRTKDVREIPIHWLCLLQQCIHLLGQWDVMGNVRDDLQTERESFE